MAFLRRCWGGAGCCWAVQTHLERREETVSCINHSCKQSSCYVLTNSHQKSELPLDLNLTIKEPNQGLYPKCRLVLLCLFSISKFYPTVSPAWRLNFLHGGVCPAQLQSSLPFLIVYMVNYLYHIVWFVFIIWIAFAIIFLPLNKF